MNQITAFVAAVPPKVWIFVGTLAATMILEYIHARNLNRPILSSVLRVFLAAFGRAAPPDTTPAEKATADQLRDVAGPPAKIGPQAAAARAELQRRLDALGPPAV